MNSMHDPVSAQALNALLLMDSCSIANAIKPLTSVCEMKASVNLAFAAGSQSCHRWLDLRQLSGSVLHLRHGKEVANSIEPIVGDIWMLSPFHKWS
jgi:hypothetical protein